MDDEGAKHLISYRELMSLPEVKTETEGQVWFFFPHNTQTCSLVNNAKDTV